MEQHVFSVSEEEKWKLMQILQNDPYEKESFASIGYLLRERNSLGLGNVRELILYFKAEGEIANKLKEKLRELKTLKRIEGEEKSKAISAFEAEEMNAAEGFGSIFG